jgi:uncharacterized protein YndB with AHSA1/START domain
MVADVIERETTIEAPVERVWSLLTEAEHLGTWFGNAGAEIDLRPGGTLLVHWKEHGTARARVERVEPPRVFAYRWGVPGAGPEPGKSTLVEFTLTAEGERTHVHVRESGFASLDLSDAGRAERYGQNEEGWRIKLGDLARHAQRVAA